MSAPWIKVLGHAKQPCCPSAPPRLGQPGTGHQLCLWGQPSSQAPFLLWWPLYSACPGRLSPWPLLQQREREVKRLTKYTCLPSTISALATKSRTTLGPCPTPWSQSECPSYSGVWPPQLFHPPKCKWSKSCNHKHWLALVFSQANWFLKRGNLSQQAQDPPASGPTAAPPLQFTGAASASSFSMRFFLFIHLRNLFRIMQNLLKHNYTVHPVIDNYRVEISKSSSQGRLSCVDSRSSFFAPLGTHEKKYDISGDHYGCLILSFPGLDIPWLFIV